MEPSVSDDLFRSSEDDKTALIHSNYTSSNSTSELTPPDSDKTQFQKLLELGATSQSADESERTLLASDSPALARPSSLGNTPPDNQSPVAKVAYGGGKAAGSPFENPFIQAETLKLAQQRILQLEREVENLRKETEILSSANEISKQKNEDLSLKVQNLEKQKHELKEVNESELEIFKDGLNAKESDVRRLKSKIEELENRLSNDLRRIRVRERELENRLELSKSEKVTLLRMKDEVILDLKRRGDQVHGELESYQNKVLELQQTLEMNQEQFARTVRALRIALTNLEVNDSTNTSITIAPFKKAE